MLVKNANVVPISNVAKPVLYQRVRQENVLVTEVEFEYQKKNSTLISRVEGLTSLTLTDSYIDDISKRFTAIQNDIVKPLVKLIDHNFTLNFKVHENGEVNMDELKLMLKMNCNSRCSVWEAFRLPFRILIPFSEYIDYLHIRGREFEVSVIEAEVNINTIDLLAVIEEPWVGPTAKSQWYAFMVEAVQEAKKDFKLDVIVPVHEGEVTWKIPHSRKLQLKETYPL